MIDTKFCKLMAEYNVWMNGKIYTACSTLPQEVLIEDRGAFFRSIYLTLNHIAYSDLAFLSRFTGEPSELTTRLKTSLADSRHYVQNESDWTIGCWTGRQRSRPIGSLIR